MRAAFLCLIEDHLEWPDISTPKAWSFIDNSMLARKKTFSLVYFNNTLSIKWVLPICTAKESKAGGVIFPEISTNESGSDKDT